MDSAKLNDRMQVLGIFAVVASLVFVGMQIRQDQDIAIVEANSLRFEHAESLANLVEKNRDIWIGGLDGDELSKEDFAVFAAMAEVLEEHYIHLYVRYLRIGPFPTEFATRDYAYVLYRNPVLRRIYEGQKAYTAAIEDAFNLIGGQNNFRASVDAGLMELDGHVIPELTEKRYILW